MSLSVLIIEDEPSIAETIIYACQAEQMQAYHVVLGQQALDVLKKQPFDMIILDIGLPDMTGFDVCKQLRRFCNTPVLFLTARNHEVDRILGLEIGADDYVTKPFSPREIVARIKAIQRRLHPEIDHAATGFQLDEHASRIYYQQQLLPLTRYEFLLLKTLILQPHRVFSRASLMDTVWQSAEDSMERTVDTHVKTLRSKLREVSLAHQLPATTLIVTHRGMGYSLLP
ncbi:two-component system response regulator CreB [Methylophilus sp. UBA6697]|jgi:two-component system catabolic regulation response regulator CreB|uniref:two-component system response regulator CreB n=1 Tax=Methylophilus sp. UBA6697 TaxID=1946902 RepID=UPI000ED41D0B|nr:two-component system response regulator CreB [Methylophilus sp. UBA6697]HCU84588.1 two-component system response regulator CreB [Methylophilus sp.]